MSALQAYKSSDRLDLALRFQRAEPNPNPAARIIIQEADPGLFEGCLDPHQGRDIAHDWARSWVRLAKMPLILDYIPITFAFDEKWILSLGGSALPRVILRASFADWISLFPRLLMGSGRGDTVFSAAMRSKRVRDRSQALASAPANRSSGKNILLAELHRDTRGQASRSFLSNPSKPE
jgi:hypothetical protein